MRAETLNSYVWIPDPLSEGLGVMGLCGISLRMDFEVSKIPNTRNVTPFSYIQIKR